MSASKSPKPISKDIAASLIAMRRAAVQARRIALQTNTAVVIFQDQKIIHLRGDDLRKSLEDI
jgi:hypothetical protein